MVPDNDLSHDKIIRLFRLPLADAACRPWVAPFKPEVRSAFLDAERKRKRDIGVLVPERLAGFAYGPAILDRFRRGRLDI